MALNRWNIYHITETDGVLTKYNFISTYYITRVFKEATAVFLIFTCFWLPSSNTHFHTGVQVKVRYRLLCSLHYWTIAK